MSSGKKLIFKTLPIFDLKETFTEGEFVPYSIDEKIDFCDNATFDAILILSDGCTYAFRGAYYWKVTNDKIMEGYPRLIQEDWAGLPTHLDAAFAYKDEIVFFKGSKYWKFTTNKIMKDGCPRYIKDGFPGIPDDIDGATPWGKHGYIYFFKGCYYWRYEPNCEHQVKKNYPKLISEVWEGVPDNIDDAILHTNGVLYFFKGVRHYRFNDAKLKTFTEGVFEPYPEYDKIDLCENATVDAIFILSNELTYVFRGPYYWKVEKNKIVEGYPRLIQEDWAGLPIHLDAAFAYKKDQILFFKGSKYWKFTDKKMDDGYPRYIKEGFPGIPDDIDGATPWGKHGYIYFFKGCYYWRYEPNCEHPVKKIYPKLISEVWEGIPDNIDDAILHTNGILYFLKGVRYYRFNDEKLKNEDGYPILSAPLWFGCYPEP
ncbi:hypothetical protein V9T40_013939 [Parthenolecanium corni]|uniref:Hemopexin n=1 Tax=Parthenolecanium corni TaxID=536013 RepID=A0AAN9TT08_9HEMI